MGVGIGFLIADISLKKVQKKYPFLKVVDISGLEEDPAIWGKNFPYQYESYRRTVDMERTRHGGSEAIPRLPSSDDPRNSVTQSKLEKDPRFVKMWAGYAFSHDFREERGHAYMLQDQMHTKRHEYSAQPGACLNCHASTYATMVKLGEGDLDKGFQKLNSMSYEQGIKHVNHPISCIDCHDPKNMQLRITRPAFKKGIAKFKKVKFGLDNYDVNKQATHQEMRTFVCAQCHVEYHFKGNGKELSFPWDEGLKGDEILAHYQKIGFKDWTHEFTGAAALKAQHPEFEMYSQGPHARAGVSCVDCHMPFERVGAAKVTNHHVRSPLLSVNKSCQTCHHRSQEDLEQSVYDIQKKHIEMRDKTMDALMEYIDAIIAAKKEGVSAQRLEKVLDFQRQAQFLIDFVEAENSAGFHAPQEAARLMVEAMDKIRRGEKELRNLRK